MMLPTTASIRTKRTSLYLRSDAMNIPDDLIQTLVKESDVIRAAATTDEWERLSKNLVPELMAIAKIGGRQKDIRVHQKENSDKLETLLKQKGFTVNVMFVASGPGVIMQIRW